MIGRCLLSASLWSMGWAAGSVDSAYQQLRSQAGDAPVAVAAERGRATIRESGRAPQGPKLDLSGVKPVNYAGATDRPVDRGRPLSMVAGLDKGRLVLSLKFEGARPALKVRTSSPWRPCPDCRPNETLETYGPWMPYPITADDVRDLRNAVQRDADDWHARFPTGVGHPMEIGGRKVVEALDRALREARFEPGERR